jgi:hypothetical protein
MSAYIITFEISDVTKKKAFDEKLKTFGGYCSINAHTCAITSEKKAIEIRDSLSQILSPTDKLFVIRSGTEAAWRNSYGKEFDEWLKKYL